MTDELAASIRSLVADAIASGKEQRRANSVREAEKKEAERRKHEEAAPARATEIISGLAAKTKAAVVNTSTLPTTCIVMFLKPYEYEGQITCSKHDHDQLEPQRLKLAGLAVFQALSKADLSPQLVFNYEPAREGESSPTHRTASIVIKVG